jgi:hypothetical protein
MGSEKILLIEIRNVDGIEHVLLDAKFINLSSNFEIRNSFPVVVPVEGKVSIEVHFKSVIPTHGLTYTDSVRKLMMPFFFKPTEQIPWAE